MAHEVADNLFPGLVLRAKFCDPPGLGTADCAQICRCDDGSDYAVKIDKPDPTTPLNEWMCSRLAEMSGIASPVCRIVDDGTGVWFGSRWESGHEPDNWWVRAKAGDIDFSLLAPMVSKIFAFDLFVNNSDRHLKNYIIRKQHHGHSILSFDYSRAWMHHGCPPPNLPMLETSNTIMGIRFLLQEFGDFIENDEIKTTCEKLRSIKSESIVSILGEMPKNWLTDALSNTIINWWNSADRLARIDNIEEGVCNGWYL